MAASALHPGYAPASPFKLVTSLAGFRQNALEPEEKLLCEGKHRGMICHVYPGSHGELTFQEAIARSCNVYFYRMGERIGHLGLIKGSPQTEHAQVAIRSIAFNGLSNRAGPGMEKESHGSRLDIGGYLQRNHRPRRP